MSLMLLPAVDVRDGKAVRLRQGESGSETDYGSPLEAARTWVESGAEWIHLVDLDAAFGTGNNRDQLRAHRQGAWRQGQYRNVRWRARRRIPRRSFGSRSRPCEHWHGSA